MNRWVRDWRMCDTHVFEREGRGPKNQADMEGWHEYHQECHALTKRKKVSHNFTDLNRCCLKQKPSISRSSSKLRRIKLIRKPTCTLELSAPVKDSLTLLLTSQNQCRRACLQMEMYRSIIWTLIVLFFSYWNPKGGAVSPVCTPILWSLQKWGE